MPSYVHLNEVVTNTSSKLHVYLRKTSGSISGISYLPLSQSLCTLCEISNEMLRNLVLSILYADSASAAEDILTGSRVNQSHDWNYQAAPLALLDIKGKSASDEDIAPSKVSSSERKIDDGNNVKKIVEVLPPEDSIAMSETSKEDLSPPNVLGDITNTVDQKASVPVDKKVVKRKDPFEALASPATSKSKTTLIQGQGFSNAPTRFGLTCSAASKHRSQQREGSQHWYYWYCSSSRRICYSQDQWPPLSHQIRPETTH